jgi:RimJ/RimL family protein N-acetyltransferase
MRNADPQLRDVRPDDAEACAAVAFRAHAAVSAAHNFPPELPSLAVAARFIQSKVDDPNTQGFLIERKGRIVGSIFLTIIPECPVAAIGPLTVDPAAEGGIGRRLLQAALRAAHQIGLTEVRLIQSPMHLRSFALYTKAGFNVCEPLLIVESAVPVTAANGDWVRLATPDDVPWCQQICHNAYGFARTFELHAAISRQIATVVERDSKIVGYACGIGFRGHAVCETTEELKSLIAHSPKLPGVGYFVPARNGELLRWLFQHGVRALWPATLMSSGGYQQPMSPFLPAMAF